MAFFKSKYRPFSETERAGAIAAAEQTESSWMTAPSFQVDCPACARKGWVSVDVEVDWDVSDGEAVPYAYMHPDRYACGVCHLSLTGDEIDRALPEIEIPDDLYFDEFYGP